MRGTRSLSVSSIGTGMSASMPNSSRSVETSAMSAVLSSSWFSLAVATGRPGRGSRRVLVGTVDLVEDGHALGRLLDHRQQFDEVVDRLPDHGSLDRQGLVRPTDIGGDEYGEADESVEVLLPVQGIAEVSNRVEFGLELVRISDRVRSELLER